ncbi:MAG: hypothetical protein WCI12_11510 [Actinomycetes bacterium]
MTSQIMLFNQKAGVVASDTLAVHNGPNGETSWPSASKIFEVGDHPLVVLCGGGASIADVHLELLIHEWIADLKEPLDTLEEYAASFLESAGDTVTELEITDHDTVPGVIEDELRDFARFSTISRSLKSGKLDGAQFDHALKLELAAYNEDNLMGNPFQDLDGDQALEIVNHLELNLQQRLWDVLELPARWCSGEVSVQLLNLAVLVLSHYVPCPRRFTRLNFVGYGQSDLTPGQVTVDIRGFWGRKMRALTYPRRPEAGSQSACWDTQAQSDAMDGFLKGIEHNLHDELIDLATTMVGSIETVTDEQAATFADEFGEALLAIEAERFADRFGAILWALTVPGMVRAADTLLTLQQLRAATRGGPAQVGGTVEVVSVERHAGVTWHRRLPLTSLTASATPHPLA